jgi:hypothetical protein
LATRTRILIAVAAVALSVGMAGECFAAFAGGSRLIYYYRETSFSAGGSGLTLFTVTNNNASNPVTVRFVVFNGTNCNTAGPFNTTLAIGETKQIVVTDFAPASTFPAGVIDLWAVNGSNQAIRFDSLTGTSVIADFGPSSTAATIVPAVKMFSDDRTQTGVIADQTLGITAAPLGIGAPLLLPQTPVSIEDTLVLFSPATNPGEVPPPSTGSSMIPMRVFPSAGGAGTQTTVSTSCVYTNTVAGTFGQGIGPGHVIAQNGAGKGILGWKFLKFNQGGISVLLGELMQSWATFDLPSSNQ